ncbi:dipeptidyl peptidase 4-like [Sycon ciliatum]|uniref:dipeptidyl peptidase 4-like n=1 Tax=Sycon ciliatum TaxID=27933 RepID=UPI0031F67A3D
MSYEAVDKGDMTLHVDDSPPSGGQPQGSNGHRSPFTEENKDLLPGGSERSQLDVAKRRRIAAVVIVLFLLALIAAVVVLVLCYNRGHTVPPPPSDSSSKRSMTFEDVFNGTFDIASLPMTWMPHASQLVQYLPNDGLIVAMSPDGKTKTTLLKFPGDDRTLEEFLQLESISPDERFALMTVGGKTQIFRHSTSAIYVVIRLGKGSPVTSEDIFQINDGLPLRLVQWTGSGSHLLYIPVAKPDIYYQHDVERNSSVVQLTTDGENQVLLHGVADWLYEEEVLHSDLAMWPSPASRYVAYITFNESVVEYFHWVDYGDSADAYVKVEKLRYPKAGHQNPIISLNVRRLGAPGTVAGSSVTLNPPEMATTDYYVTNVVWLNQTHICVQWMPRLQTVAYLTAYDVSSSNSGSLSPVMTLRLQAVVGWVEIYPHKSVLNGRAVLTKIPRPESPHYVHMALVYITPGNGPLTPHFLTNGEWEVSSIDAVDTNSEYVLFQTTASGPEYRHMYYQALTTGAAVSVCLTCTEDDSCQFNTFKVSKAADYMVWDCRGPGLPRTQIARISATGAEVLNYAENYTAFAAASNSLDLPDVQYLRLPVNGLHLPAMRISPNDESDTEKLPTLMYGYNGPLAQTVTAKNPLLSNGDLGRWLMYLVSEHRFQIFIVDGRGTPYLGDSFGKAQYLRIGEVESSDQISAARHIMKNFDADAERMAFWGWSYGGFLSSYIATRPDNVFQVCMATSPVTDWRYYDTAYTERMEGLPSQNVHYLNNSIVKRADRFGKTKFLVIHGSGDDNVHFQNTAQLAAALTHFKVQFRMQIYTDKAHSLRGQNTEYHLYTLLTDFLLTSFKMNK